jgi:hypothetical protein
MKIPKLAKSALDFKIAELVKLADHRTLAVWAADCAERSLKYFEIIFPGDDRPRKAIFACRAWTREEMKISEVRKLALAAHAAARSAQGYPGAEAAARSAGQAAGTSHVSAHSIYAAQYSATAVRNLSNGNQSNEAVEEERKWQYRHLLELISSW